MGDVPLNMISADDIGHIIRRIIELGPEMHHKTVSVSASKQTIREISAVMARQLSPKSVFFKQVI